MKLKKLFVGLVSLAAALFAVCAISVCAGAESSGYWEYKVSDDIVKTATVTGYKGFTDTLTIPSTIDGYTVTEIGLNAFYGAENFNSVIIPDTVYYIDDSAFRRSSIQSVTVPNSVKSMGYNVFGQCINLTKVYFGNGPVWSDRSIFDGSPNVVIYCYPDSPIQKYAKENDIPYSLQEAIPATSIKLDKTTVVLDSYDNICAMLNATLSPANSTDAITWTSADEDIARPIYGSNLIYSTYDTGTVAIRATTTSGVSAICNVTVVSDIPEDVGEVKLLDRGSDYINVNWTEAEYADGYIVEKLVDGKWTRVKKITNSWTTVCAVTDLSPSTTYSIRVRSYQMAGSVAVYSAYKTGKWATAPSTVSGFKAKARSASALRLGWTKNTTADGYILERKSGTTWNQIANITKNSTVEYRVSGLKAGTSYSFRIKSYKKNGSSILYSTYKTISEATMPTAVSGLKLKARAADALLLTWTKNTSADGYIIEMKDGAKWTRVGKITSNSTVEFKKSKLKAGTAYTFRVKAYKMSGKTALYGATKTISVRTNPSATTGLKLKNSAKNAVRLSWTKNTSADGYIVEMKVNGVWKRAGKITKNSTIEFKKSGLKSKTSYTFRVKAYKMSGKTALYGATKTITVKTK